MDKIVSEEAHKDRRKKETINVLTPKQIFHALFDKFGYVVQGIHLTYTDGEVTTDSRGEGSIQVVTAVE